jgi:hypothetical protein
MSNTLDIAVFQHQEDKTPQSHQIAWDKFAQRLAKHDERQAKNGRLWSPTKYVAGMTRSKDGVATVTALVFDFDHQCGEPDWTPLEGYEYVAHTTWKHHAGDSHPECQGRPDCSHWRIILPLAREVTGTQWPEVWVRARHLLCPEADKAAKDASRIYYLPSCRPGNPRDVRRNEGRPVDPDTLPPLPKPPPRSKPERTGSTYSGEERPGDRFNREASWAEVLEPHGWECVREGGGEEFWRRPGKAGADHSATVNYADTDLFHVFSSNAAPFEPGESYQKFSAFVLLDHGGDFTAGARAAADRFGMSPNGRASIGGDGANAVEKGPNLGPIDLPDLLWNVQEYVRRYVVLSFDQGVMVALWIAHTHVIEAFDMTPYLHISSAVKRCGKSRLLEVAEPVVARPWKADSVSTAALVRKVEQECPTLLLDESDPAFNGDKEYAETLRGLLNSGYRRGGKRTMCVGQGADYKDFSTFCPKAFAGIGKLPDTLEDRSIPIRVERKKKSERVERFREREANSTTEPLAALLEGFGAEHSDELREARPDLPDELNDRAQDVCEPLLAIADLASPEWAKWARHAAVALCSDTEPDDDDAGLLLLSGIREVFGDEDRLASKEICDRLKDLEEAPWATWGTRRTAPGITERDIAKLPRDYRVRPKTIRFHDGATSKGYLREQFEDAWERYLSLSGSLNVTAVTTRIPSGIAGFSRPSQEADVTDGKSGANPHHKRDVTDVTDTDPEKGAS